MAAGVAWDGTPTVAGGVTPTVALVAASAVASVAGSFGKQTSKTEKQSNTFYFCSAIT